MSGKNIRVTNPIVVIVLLLDCMVIPFGGDEVERLIIINSKFTP